MPTILRRDEKCLNLNVQLFFCIAIVSESSAVCLIGIDIGVPGFTVEEFHRSRNLPKSDRAGGLGDGSPPIGSRVKHQEILGKRPQKLKNVKLVRFIIENLGCNEYRNRAWTVFLCKH